MFLQKSTREWSEEKDERLGIYQVYTCVKHDDLIIIYFLIRVHFTKYIPCTWQIRDLADYG